MAIPDGASGGFFGTCNGTQAWCATVDGDRNRITTAGEMGTCVAASQVGDPCGLFPSANVCARGTQCSVDGVCEAEAVVGPVGVGEPCWDTENFRELGKCQDSYCDLLGDGTCLPFKENGETCEGINQCLSYGCTTAHASSVPTAAVTTRSSRPVGLVLNRRLTPPEFGVGQRGPRQRAQRDRGWLNRVTSPFLILTSMSCASAMFPWASRWPLLHAQESRPEVEPS